MPGHADALFVNCGLSGPYVQAGTVEVPSDVWASIKAITCSPH